MVLEDKKLKDYLGNYTYYREKEQEAVELSEKKRTEEPAKEAKKISPPAMAAPRNAAAKTPSYGTAQQIDKLEMKIAEWEATLKMYEFQMNQPEMQLNPNELTAINNEYMKVQDELEAAYEKWEALCDKQ